jgi:hypothetical protein
MSPHAPRRRPFNPVLPGADDVKTTTPLHDATYPLVDEPEGILVVVVVVVVVLGATQTFGN